MDGLSLQKSEDFMLMSAIKKDKYWNPDKIRINLYKLKNKL